MAEYRVTVMHRETYVVEADTPAEARNLWFEGFRQDDTADIVTEVA